VLLTRVPQLAGSPFLPDGDEALLALIARNALSGEAIPLFLWGQRYGLAAPEIALVSAAFAAFGESGAALHGAVLILWTAGVLLLVAAVFRMHGRAAGLWTAGLMVVAPAWMSISMRAWGTSVTGFFFAALALWCAAIGVGARGGTAADRMARRGEPPSASRMGAAAVAGMATMLSALANPLWLLFALPLVGSALGSRAGQRQWRAAGAGALLTVAAASIAVLRARGYWEPPVFSDPAPVQSLMRLPERLWLAFTGTYALGRLTSVGPVASLAGGALAVTSFAFLLRSIARITQDEAVSLEKGGVVAAVAGLLASIAMHPRFFAFRYLLPPVTALLMLTGLALPALSQRVRSLAAALGVVVAAARPRSARHLVADPSASCPRDSRPR
jgi:hypothetical protein